MNKKNKIMLVALSIIIVFILIIVICPMILNSVEQSKYSSFNSSKNKILQSAQNKYSADVNNVNNTVTQYTIGELIEGGYIDANTKNPLTGKKYDKDTKVIVSNENGKIKLYYINGNTMLELIRELNSDSGVYFENNEYIYKGNKAKNYISFNQSIYRIMKVDNLGYMYIIKDECSKLITKNNIESNLLTVYNDKFDEYMKKMMDSKLNILTKDEYNNSLIDGETFIKSNKDMWLKDENSYKLLDGISFEIYDSSSNEKGCLKYITKLKNNVVIENGDGSQFSPYIINMKNY